MDKDIINAWDNAQQKLRYYLRTNAQSGYDSYEELLKLSLSFMFSKDDYGMPSSDLITKIDNGDYQGTLVFVIGGYGYQPGVDDHWYTSVGYGSCSGCDTLQSINSYEEGLPSEEQVNGYWTLCLHMIQKMRRMKDDD